MCIRSSPPPEFLEFLITKFITVGNWVMFAAIAKYYTSPALSIFAQVGKG